MHQQDERKVRQIIKDVRHGFESGIIDEKLRTGDPEYYDIVTLQYPFGKRQAYRKKVQQDYELLQGSRGGVAPILEDVDSIEIESIFEPLKKNIKKLKEGDIVRSQELEDINTLESMWGFRLKEMKSFCELGFRVPRLLKHYREKYEMQVSGYDVLQVNIIMGKHVGYDVHRYDFDECNEALEIDADLVVSYHMLEHVTDPLMALTKIYEAMKPGAFFHVEIPVEGPGMPNIRYCHMYAFHPQDMGLMLELAGFKVYTLSNQTHEGGPYIERYLVQKTENGRSGVHSVPHSAHYRTWEIS